MAITNADIASLPTYTAAEQLKVWQKASVDLAVAGVSRAIAGRTLTVSNASEVAKMIQFWQEQVNAESADASGGIALIEYVERV